MFAGVAVFGVIGAASMGAFDDNKGWVCQTAAAAEQDYRGLRKCYRLAEYCEGECEFIEQAHCHDLDTSVAYGNYQHYDRNCFATAADCETARAHNDRTQSECRVRTR